MNKKTSARSKKETKAKEVKIRLTPRQKSYWEHSIRQLQFGEISLSTYVRYAVDRSISLDFQSKDPKWQAFLVAVSKQAKKMLGHKLVDNLEGRRAAVRSLDT